jgi:hypothetical protein
VLYSALDAHIRQLKVTVPRDAVAHIHQDLAEAALMMMERNMEAQIPGHSTGHCPYWPFRKALAATSRSATSPAYAASLSSERSTAEG